MSTWRFLFYAEQKRVQLIITRVALTEYLELLCDKYCSYIAVHGFSPVEFSTG